MRDVEWECDELLLPYATADHRETRRRRRAGSGSDLANTLAQPKRQRIQAQVLCVF